MPSGLARKLHFARDLLLAKATGKSVPFFVQASITTICNLSCSYCYAVYPQRKITDQPKETWFKLFDELAEMGTRRINLVGGEPLLRRDTGELIKYIKNAGMECAMTSNGYLVPSRIEELKNLDLLCISLDGDKHSHDLNRGKDTWEKAMKAVEVGKAAGIEMQVATVLTKNSIGSIDYMLDLTEKYGLIVGFSTLINQTVDGVASPVADLTPSDAEYKEALKKVIQKKKEGARILFSDKTYKFALDWPYDYGTDKVSKDPGIAFPKCHAGEFFCIIDTNGKVYPCAQWVGGRPALSAFEVGFKKAFEAAQNHGCKACHVACTTEYNYLFDLDKDIITNLFKSYRPVNASGVPKGIGLPVAQNKVQQESTAKLPTVA